MEDYKEGEIGYCKKINFQLLIKEVTLHSCLGLSWLGGYGLNVSKPSSVSISQNGFSHLQIVFVLTYREQRKV